jgi:hypothetical protein
LKERGGDAYVHETSGCESLKSLSAETSTTEPSPVGVETYVLKRQVRGVHVVNLGGKIGNPYGTTGAGLAVFQHGLTHIGIKITILLVVHALERSSHVTYARTGLCIGPGTVLRHTLLLDIVRR